MTVTAHPMRQIGPWSVPAIGLGCMPLSVSPSLRPDSASDRERAIGVVHAALDAGVRLLDTADIYAPSWDTFGHNEVLVGEAVRSWRGAVNDAPVVIATKAGITRGPGEAWGRNATLDYLMRAVEASLGRLGVDRIQVWQHHRLDPSLTFEDQFENVLVLRDRGLVESIALSNVNDQLLRRAIALGGTPAEGGVVSVQNEFSPKYRHAADVITTCEAYGIAYLPWSPLGGMRQASELAHRFRVFAEVGAEHGESAHVVALAWLLQLSDVMIPIPGVSRVESLHDSIRAMSLTLTAEEIAALNASLPESVPVSEELMPAPAFRS